MHSIYVHLSVHVSHTMELEYLIYLKREGMGEGENVLTFINK